MRGKYRFKGAFREGEPQRSDSLRLKADRETARESGPGAGMGVSTGRRRGIWSGEGVQGCGGEVRCVRTDRSTSWRPGRTLALAVL